MGLRSLSEIRGGNQSSDSTSSGGGLKSMDQIRAGRFNFADQQKSLMDNYDEMAAVNPPSLSSEGVKQTYGANPLDLGSSPVIKQAQQYAQSHPPAPAEEPSLLDRVLSVPKAIDKGVQGFLDAGANTLTLGLHNKLINNFSDPQRIQNEHTIPGTIGEYAGLVAPLEAAYAGVGKLLPEVINNAPKLVKNLVRGAGAGLLYGGAKEGLDAAIDTRMDGNQSLGQRAKNVGLDAAMFGGGDAALGLAGSGLQRLAGTKLGQAVTDFFSRSKATSPAAEQATQDILALPPASRYEAAKVRSQGNVLPTNEAPIYGKGDVHTFELPASTLPKEVQAIKEEVGQRITPPYENPNELAKYVKTHLGDNISLNEVRTLPYNDLSELANEIHTSHLDNTHAIASQVAKEKGYNWDELLQGRAVTGNAAAPLDKVGFKSQLQSMKDIKGSRTETQPGVEMITPERKFAADQAGSLKSIKEIRGNKQSGKLQSMKEIRNPAPAAENVPTNPTKEQEAVLHQSVTPEPRLRDKLVSFADEQAAAARERIKARGNRLSSVPVDQWTDHAIIGASHIVKNGVKFADFSEAMIKEFGQQIKPHLAEIYQKSVQLAKKNAKLSEKDIQRSRNMAQFERNNAVPGVPDTKGQLTTKTKRELRTVGQKTNELYIKNIDNLHRFNNFDHYVSEVLGRKLNASEETHTLGLNSRSSDVIADNILTKQIVDAKGDPIRMVDASGNPMLDAKGKPIKSFKDLTKQIPRGKQAEFEDYLIAKHADTRMQRGEKVYKDELQMSPEKARMIAADYEAKYPQFKQIAEHYYEFNRQMGQAWLVDTEMVPQQVFDSWLRENPYYISNQRQFSELEKAKTFNNNGGGFVNGTKPVKEVSHVGSQRKIISPIESTIEQIDRYVKAAKRNEVKQVLYDHLVRNPDDLQGWANIVGKEKFDTKQVLDEHGMDGLLEELDAPVTKPQGKTDLTHGNVVPLFKNGEKVHIEVQDPQMLDALSNLHPGTQQTLIKVMAQITRMMKSLTTGNNPIFSLTRNIFRDVPEAYKNSVTTNNPVKFAWDLGHSIVSQMGNGKLAQSYRAVGGGHSGNISASRNLLSQSKNKILQAQKLSDYASKLVKTPFHLLENFNSAIEQAPRMGEFKRTVQKGEGTYDSKVSGLARANDVTVNFNRYGQVSKDVDAVFPYYNAAVQGLDKFARSFNFIKDPKQASLVALKSVGAVTIPTVVLYAINHNDPNYNKLSNYIKDNYFLFPKGDGTFYKVPKSRETGMLFGALVERSLRAWKDHDPQAFKDFATSIKNSFAPPGINGMIDTENNTITPTGALTEFTLGPLVSVLQNKDYANRPIVPKDLQDGRSPKLQYDNKTSEVGKLIGAKLNKSPKQVDYLIKSYGGVVGQLGLPLTTKGNGVGQALQQQVTADPAYSNDVSRDFYNAKAKFDQQKADAKVQGKLSNTLGLDSYLNKVSANVATLRKQMNVIQNNPKLSNEDKQTKMKAIQVQMNNMQSQALDQLKKIAR